MVIRYDSAHRGLIISLFSFSIFFIIIIANSFVERGGNLTSAAVLPVVVVVINSKVSLLSKWCVACGSHQVKS